MDNNQNKSFKYSLSINDKPIVHDVFIIGAKSIGQYGGYETFLDKLTKMHASEPSIKYHIVTKANGEGARTEEERVRENGHAGQEAQQIRTLITHLTEAEAI